MNRSLFIAICLGFFLANAAESGEFIKKALGTDAEGKPIYQYVYQAGKSKFARSAVTRHPWNGYGYGYGYRYPTRHVIRVPKRTPTRYRSSRPTTRTRASTRSTVRRSSRSPR